jgi:hypothetical protein
MTPSAIFNIVQHFDFVGWCFIQLDALLKGSARNGCSLRNHPTLVGSDDVTFVLPDGKCSDGTGIDRTFCEARGVGASYDHRQYR